MMRFLQTGHFLSVFPIVWAHRIQQLVCPHGTKANLAWMGSVQTTHSLPLPGRFPGCILGTLDCISMLHFQQWLQFSLQSWQTPVSPQGKNLMIDFCCLHKAHSSIAAGASTLCSWTCTSFGLGWKELMFIALLNQSNKSIFFSIL